MPIYEYVCQDCRQDDERMVSYMQRDEQDCHKCKGKLFRKISIPGYVWQPTKEKHRGS